MSIERQREQLQRQLDDIERGIDDVQASRGEQFTVKQLMKTEKGLKRSSTSSTIPSVRIRSLTLNSSALTDFLLTRAIFTRICTSIPRCGMWAASPRPKPRKVLTSL